ncbi:10377_t:CDS:2 [Diversispora eburnea]|uniref:10377_t:CDS:1 n=1 Tax=Diversispora eburnea TaxID=1213867 RepID=A0A9N9GCW4_9GLOM|nr:10377_t:CDS:2 [Diversispora eburnea]
MIKKDTVLIWPQLKRKIKENSVLKFLQVIVKVTKEPSKSEVHNEEELSQITSLILKYSIVADLQNQKTNITYGQLFLVERPFTISIISIHDESKRAVGEIFNFLFEVGGCQIPIDVIVTDAQTYQVIIRNDWFSKVKTNIDWCTSEIIFLWNNQKVKVLVEFRKLLFQPLESDRLVIVKSLKDQDEESEKLRELQSEDEFRVLFQDKRNLKEDLERSFNKENGDDEINEILDCYFFNEDKASDVEINSELERK